MRAVLFAIGLLAAALSMPRQAAADVLNTYLALTCDSVANRAMVRFGHADNDDLPEFLSLPGVGPDDLSRRAVANARTKERSYERAQEVSCRLPDGREVKARYGYGPLRGGLAPSLVAPIFSIWLGKAKVLSRARLDTADCQDCLVHSVLLDRRSATRCDFRLTEHDSPYALSPAQIACGRPAPLAGVYDTVEYPKAGAPAAPRVGSLQIERGAEARACRALAVDDRVSLRNVGGEFPEFPLSTLTRPTNSGFYVIAGRAPFENDGRPKRVYKLSAHSRYFDGDVLLVTPESVPETEVTTLIAKALSGGDVEALPALARRRGWTVYSGADMPSERLRYTNLKPFRFRGAQYLLADSELFEPAGMVLKPGPNGAFERSCILRRVWPNF